MPTPKPVRAGKLSTAEIHAARIEAQRQIDERDRYVRQFDETAAFRNQLVHQIRAIRARHGNVEQAITDGDRDPVLVERWRLLMQLRGEIDRCDRELAELDFATGDRAFDEESAHRATVRVLLERGAKPGWIATAWDPDLSSAEVSDSSARVTAQNYRTALRAYYEKLLARLEADLARARAGRVYCKHVPIAMLIEKADARAARIRRIVAALTPRQAKANAEQSAL